MVIFHVVAEKGTKMRHFEKTRGFHEFGSIEFHRGNVVFSTWEVPIDTSSTIAIQDLTWRDNHFLYPDAPCMEYLPTKVVDFWGKCRDSYSIHGAYGLDVSLKPSHWSAPAASCYYSFFGNALAVQKLQVISLLLDGGFQSHGGTASFHRRHGWPWLRKKVNNHGDGDSPWPTPYMKNEGCKTIWNLGIPHDLRTTTIPQTF
jgi:hypothetical protein